MTGKYYVWDDIRSKNIMKEFHFMKALGKRTILKVGKIKVAREVNINTDSTKKLNPVLATRRTRGVPGLECALQLCSQGPRK